MQQSSGRLDAAESVSGPVPEVPREHRRVQQGKPQTLHDCQEDALCPESQQPHLVSTEQE